MLLQNKKICYGFLILTKLVGKKDFSTASRVSRNMGSLIIHDTILNFAFFCTLARFFFNPGDFRVFFFLHFFFVIATQYFRIARFRFTKSMSWAVTRRLREIFPIHYHSRLKTAFKVLGRWHRYERHGVFFSWNEGVCEIKMGKKSSKVDSFFQFVFFSIFFSFCAWSLFLFSPNFAVPFLSHILGGFFMPN